MKKHYRKNRYLLFVIGSWLFTKLRSTIELSRLALFRSTRQPEIRFVIHKYKKHPQLITSYHDQRVTLIYMNDEKSRLVVSRLPVICKN
ncbi:MAG: hypothetical protein SCK70_02780 [bacterium]|nr:hypothetical protein [bacterium]